MLPNASSVDFNIASWIIDRQAIDTPEAIALYSGADTVTYQALARMVERAGEGFLRLGCEFGDRVLIALSDSPELVASFLGAAKIGALATLVSPWASTMEYSLYLRDSQPKLSVIHQGNQPFFEAAKSQRTQLIVVDDESPSAPSFSWSRFLAQSSGRVGTRAVSQADAALILYTSGSTGRPKGAVHKHEGFLHTAKTYAQEILSYGKSDKVLSISKLFFAYGLENGLCHALAAGASCVLCQNKMTLRAFADLVEVHRPTVLVGTPSFYRAVMTEAGRSVDIDFSSFRLMLSAGEALPAPIYQGFRSRFDVEILDGFGSTEMLNTFISNRQGASRQGSCGTIVNGYEARLVGEDGSFVPPNVIGSLWVRGTSSFSSYRNEVDLTSRTKTEDGWVLTNDLMVRDNDGFFYYAGRLNDKVKAHGLWVNLAEVEEVLYRVPGIERAKVIQVPLNSGDFRLMPFVTQQPNSRIDEMTFRKLLSKQLSTVPALEPLVVIPEFPLTLNGKVDLVALSEMGRRVLITEGRESLAAIEKTASSTEEWLRQIWESLLGRLNISVSEDFLSLGGHSIIAVQCISRINRMYDVDIPIDLFFREEASVRFIANVIDELRAYQ